VHCILLAGEIFYHERMYVCILWCSWVIFSLQLYYVSGTIDRRLWVYYVTTTWSTILAFDIKPGAWRQRTLLLVIGLIDL
jgi:hypothetical protein